MKDKNTVAQKPPMGWNSWDCFGASVTERQLLANAAYIDRYLKEYGFEYVVCDIQWSEPTADSNDYHPFAPLCMDEYSRLIPAENRFPSSAGGKGFKPIADKIHAMGLKFGIHIMRGIPRQAVHQNTAILGTDKRARDIAHTFSVCPWNTDMYGVDVRKDGAKEYYDSLFKLYASWDVDFIKCDDICNTEFKPHDPYSAREEIEMIRTAIDNCGRDMVLSLSPGPAQISVAEHLSTYANMWRLTGDFWDSWDKLKDMFFKCKQWYPYVKEGCWPDCDMLPLGRLTKNKSYLGQKDRRTNFTRDEQITLMTLWCIFRSPLMLGGNLPDNTPWDKSLLTNKEVLAVNQEGDRPEPVIYDGNKIVWKSKAKDGLYLAMFNIGDELEKVSVTLSALGLTGKKTIRNLWNHSDIGQTDGEISFTIPKHGAKLLLLK